jgi:hypothetical protein
MLGATVDGTSPCLRSPSSILDSQSSKQGLQGSLPEYPRTSPSLEL